jgi:predicted dehydrogenase
MSTPARLAWGILGTGRIAGQFAIGLNASDRNSLAAVGSRSAATAAAFAAAHRAPAAYGSYEAVLTNPAVQAVYVALPNSMHHEWTLRALAAGKHVLCEKPLATNLAQAEEMFDAAHRRGLVLAEAFMYRSHPFTHAVQRAVAEGQIGRLCVVRTSFVFVPVKMEGNIKFSTALSGGSVMDVGCYCVSYARLFAGEEPVAITAAGHLHPAGVDDYAVGTLAFPGGLLANFACGMVARADNTAHLLGTDGHLEIPLPWKPPAVDAEFIRVDAAGVRHTTRMSAHKDLYGMEADDFAATVLDAAPQRVSPAFSLGNQRCLDAIRRQIGLSF